MLNLTLRDKIEYPEYRLLYDSKMRLTEYTLRQTMRTYIKRIRNEYNSNAMIDPLLDKLTKHGNTGGWYTVKLRELERLIYDANKSTVSADFQGQWRSIEFELVFKNEAAMNDFARDVRSKGYSKYVTIKHDGSIRPDDDDGEGRNHCKEVAVSYRSGNEQVIKDVCAALKDRAYINNSCGTHVHFDMRHVNERQVKQYAKRIARAVPALKAILPKSRRNNRYCNTTINDMRRGERYSFVNLQAYEKYQTLEIRGHSATLRADKILNWIGICEKIMTSRIRSMLDEITTPQELIKIYSFDGDLAKYITSRHSKFNTAKDITAAAAAVPAPVAIPAAPAG